MTRIVVVVVAVLGSLWPGASWGTVVHECGHTAKVSWRTDWGDATVQAALVEVPGCDDEELGLQLLTTHGDVPDVPMKVAMSGGVALFDLAALDIDAEPVIGVRVILDGTVVGTFDITVDLRFFNPAGNEQVGRRTTTTTQVDSGETYRVPDAPRGYQVADCGDFDLPQTEHLIGEGPGVFEASEPGVHIACYQHSAREGNDIDILGVEATAAVSGDSTGGQLLPSTGAKFGPRLFVLGGSCLLLGGVLVLVPRARRRVSDDCQSTVSRA